MRLTGFCRVLQLSVLQICKFISPLHYNLFRTIQRVTCRPCLQLVSVHTQQYAVSQFTRYRQSKHLDDVSSHDTLCATFTIALCARNLLSHTWLI